MKRLTLLGAALVPLLLVACAPSVTPPQPRGLENVVLALGTSPPTHDFAGDGHLLLVRADGTVTSVSHAGMDVIKPIWTESGLFYSDTREDVRLGAGESRVSSPKANVQTEVFPSADGSHVTGIYNLGVLPEGYLTEVVTTDGTTSEKHTVAGNQMTMSRCGEHIYGIADASGPLVAEAERRAGKQPGDRVEMLTTLDGEQRVVGARRTPERNYPVGSAAPCSDGTVVFLGQQTMPDNGDSFRVQSWRTSDGRVVERPLLDETGAPLAIDLDTFAGVITDPVELVAGRLVWIDVRGVVRATDPQTGRTATLFTVPLRQGGQVPSVQFVPGAVLVLDVPAYDDPDGAAELRRCTFTDGTYRTILTSQQLTKELAGMRREVPRGIAVAPSAWTG